MPTRWSEELTRADTVLVVDDIARAALRLGDSVTVERIPAPFTTSSSHAPMRETSRTSGSTAGS